jgi:hypothetical protein
MWSRFYPQKRITKKETFNRSRLFPRKYYKRKIEMELVLGFVVTTREVPYCLVSRHPLWSIELKSLMGIRSWCSRRLADPLILRPCSDKCNVVICNLASNLLHVVHCSIFALSNTIESWMHFVIFPPYFRDFCVITLRMCDVLRNCYI